MRIRHRSTAHRFAFLLLCPGLLLLFSSGVRAQVVKVTVVGVKAGKYKVRAEITGSLPSDPVDVTVSEGSDQEIAITIKEAPKPPAPPAPPNQPGQPNQPAPPNQPAQPNQP